MNNARWRNNALQTMLQCMYSCPAFLSVTWFYTLFPMQQTEEKVYHDEVDVLCQTTWATTIFENMLFHLLDHNEKHEGVHVLYMWAHNANARIMASLSEQIQTVFHVSQNMDLIFFPVYLDTTFLILSRNITLFVVLHNVKHIYDTRELAYSRHVCKAWISNYMPRNILGCNYLSEP